MTKQDILDKLQKENPSSIPTFKAMEWWAKQQAVAFMQWNSRMYTMGIDRQADQWFDHKGKCVASSTEELYGQFIASQNNPTSFYYTGNQFIEQQNKEQ